MSDLFVKFSSVNLLKSPDPKVVAVVKHECVLLYFLASVSGEKNLENQNGFWMGDPLKLQHGQHDSGSWLLLREASGERFCLFICSPMADLIKPVETCDSQIFHIHIEQRRHYSLLSLKSVL